MLLSLPYRQEFTNVVAAFMEEIGSCYGANSTEQYHLRLIGEEAFSFIMGGIPGQNFSETFFLRCVTLEDRLAFSFTNHGRPLNSRKIEEFSPEDAEGTAAGLSLKIIKGFCNELSFHNHGKNGWELLVTFKINNYKNFSQPNAVSEASPAPSSGSKFSIRQATIADVPDIINLVYNTYRYSYAKDFAYNDQLLAEAIGSGTIISLVVVDGDGKIVGHQAVILEGDQLGELGMAMIDQHFRSGRAFLALKYHTVKLLRSEYRKIVLYAKAVTSHKSSQAFMTESTIALMEPSLYEHASFIGLTAGSNARETLIYGYVSFAENPYAPLVYLPPEHLEFTQGLFSGSSVPIVLQGVSRNGALPSVSCFDVKVNAGNRHACIVFYTIGQDFSKILLQSSRTLQQDGVITINTFLAADSALPPGTDEHLLHNGYFYCGLKPTPLGNWRVVYTNLLHQKFDFDQVQLYSTKAIELRDYIKKNHDLIV